MDYPGTSALAGFFATSVAGALVGGLVGAVSSVASSLINHETIEFKGAWEDAKRSSNRLF